MTPMPMLLQDYVRQHITFLNFHMTFELEANLMDKGLKGRVVQGLRGLIPEFASFIQIARQTGGRLFGQVF